MANNKGTVIQVMGPVLDIQFADDQLPKLPGGGTLQRGGAACELPCLQEGL